MPERGSQHHAPLVLQLLRNREEQLAAKAQDNPVGTHPGVLYVARPAADESEFDTVIEWISVFFRIFSLAIFSGVFYLLWSIALKWAGY